MKRIVDLELWSLSLEAQMPFDGKLIAEECRTSTGLPDDVVLGLNYIPDATDTTNLEISISRGEVATQVFQEFCAKHNLLHDRHDPLSAGRFLAYAFGQPLAWLHFPAGAEGLAMARQMLTWASSRRFIVVAAQGEAPLSMVQPTCCIDRLNPPSMEDFSITAHATCRAAPTLNGSYVHQCHSARN